MEINVQGVNITLTDDQLFTIQKQLQRKKLSVIERVNSYEDACEELSKDAIESMPFPKPTTEDHHYYNTVHKLLTISEALREGKILNWDDSNEKKWGCWFDMRGGFSFCDAYYDNWSTFAFAAARLCVDTEPKAAHFGKNFLPLWKIYHGHKK